MASDYEQIREGNIRKYGEEWDHLEFFDQLYPHRTHFILELLQNAEDAEATDIEFHLYDDCLEVRHNGRVFNETDVKGVCGIGKGTKRDDVTKIGRFGIGFKSVYAYTAAPEVHSGDEHFRIEHYVRPYAAEPLSAGDEWTTIFTFPFNHEVVPPEQAFREIADRLQNLNARTLLFLRHILTVSWIVEGRNRGTYLRDDAGSLGAARRVVVLGQTGGEETDEEWIMFARPVQTPTGKETRVEVAYRVVRDEKTGEEVIERVVDSCLVVFFPTIKETHLGFLIQGPYRTTPGRESVQEDDEWNSRLLKETARLVVESLFHLRDEGLMSADLLQTMPIEPVKFRGSMFLPIYEAVRDALATQPLLPTSAGGFASGREVKVARGTGLVDLFSSEQLGDLFKRDEPLHWLTNDITEVRTPPLYWYLVGRQARMAADSTPALVPEMEITPQVVARRLTEQFLTKQDDVWMIQLYRFLANQPSVIDVVRNMPILRLQSGKQVEPFDDDGAPRAYLPPPGETECRIVRRDVAADPKARGFLEGLGLTEPDIAVEVMEKILPKYESDAAYNISAQEHREDLEKIASALESSEGPNREQLEARLPEVPFLLGRRTSGGFEFKQPNELYFPKPELEMYFARNPDIWFLAEELHPMSDVLFSFGIFRSVYIWREDPDYTGHVAIVYDRGNHERGLDGFDPNCNVDGLGFALMTITEEKAWFIWNQILPEIRGQIRGKVERSTRQTYEYSQLKDMYSTAGKALVKLQWLPGQDGRWHRPADLSLDDLPEGFKRDEAVAAALGMRTGTLTAAADYLGVSVEDVTFFRDHLDDCRNFIEAQRREHEERARAEQSPSPKVIDYASELGKAFDRPGTEKAQDDLWLVDDVVEDPEGRVERIQKELKAAMAKEPHPVQRFRRVPAKKWEGKDSAVRAFLLQQYGGKCQICGAGFLKRSGEPYFEGLYLVPHTVQSWLDREGNVLSLCPTCCAKMEHGAVEGEDVQQQIEAFVPRQLGGMGEPVIRIKLLGKDTEITFTERHLLDLQTMLRAAEKATA